MKFHSHCLYIGTALLFVFSAISCQQEGNREVVIGETWKGQVPLALRKEIPQKGYISDPKSWAKLWTTYRGEEQLPNIDFNKEIVLVAVGDDPNGLGLNTKLHENGDLEIEYTCTLIGYSNPTTAAYVFTQISRKGIKTISGKPIE